MKTSISDYHEYRNACLEAATDDEKFKVFKQNPAYTEILEHTSPEIGARLADYILKTKFDFNKLEAIKSNDYQGSAYIVEYSEPFGYISPSTIYYTKIVAELEEMFGSLDGLNIAEIGIGYGGQCKVIYDYFKPASYTLVDLPEAVKLAERYHRDFNYEGIKYLTQDLLPSNTEYDLVISNYAITECARPIQLEYLDKVVKKSKRGYIAYNEISSGFGVDSLLKQQLTSIITCFEKPEEPLTGNNNCILYW
jgi:hypothetical protein